MINSMKYLSGCAMGLLATLSPIRPLIFCAVVFVAIDFVTGIAASRKQAKENHCEWVFESAKAWNTVVKLTLIMTGIVMAWLIDSAILGFMTLRLANLFTGFACGVEFWSYLENAAFISDHPMFRRLRRLMEHKLNSSLQGEADSPSSDDNDDKPRSEEQ